MEKYNFNKQYQVSVSIVANDDDFENSELLTDKRDNAEKNSSPANKNESEQITSIYFQSAHTDDKLNTNNTFVLHDNDINAGFQHNSQTTVNPQNRFTHSHSSTAYGDVSSNNPPMKQNNNELDILSKYIINIVKAYRHFCTRLRKCRNNEILKKKCNEIYLLIKQHYFRISRDIMKKTVIPQGNKFNVTEFLSKTTQIAMDEKNVICTYKNVEEVYNEIISSCYNTVSSHGGKKVCHAPTKIINKGNNSLSQKDLQNYRLCNNITQPMNNEPNATFFGNLQNKLPYNNKPETINKEPNKTLQQNSENEGYSSDITQPITNTNNQSDIPAIYQYTALQELLQNDNYFTKTRHKAPTSVLTSNHKSDSQSNNVIPNINIRHNSRVQRNSENSRNYNNEQQNSADLILLENPTTCVFQYGYLDNEIRLDINTQLLNDINTKNHDYNHWHTNDPNHTKTKHTPEDLRIFVQATESLHASTNQIYQDATTNILQEPTRSTSRDSGFMSPCNNQINEQYSNREGQNPTSPYISKMPSLSQNVQKPIPLGACHVCGESTKKKCIRCFKSYYCSKYCQKQHWSRHQFECANEGL